MKMHIQEDSKDLKVQTVFVRLGGGSFFLGARNNKYWDGMVQCTDGIDERWWLWFVLRLPCSGSGSGSVLEAGSSVSSFFFHHGP